MRNCLSSVFLSIYWSRPLFHPLSIHLFFCLSVPSSFVHLFFCLSICSSIHSFIHLFFCLSVRSSIRSSIHSLVIRPSVHSSVRLSIRSFVHPFVRPSVRSSIRSSFRPSICSSVYSFVHPFVRPSVLLFVRSFVHPSSVLPSVRSFIRLHVHVHPSVHPPIHLSVCPSMFHLAIVHTYIIFLHFICCYCCFLLLLFIILSAFCSCFCFVHPYYAHFVVAWVVNNFLSDSFFLSNLEIRLCLYGRRYCVLVFYSIIVLTLQFPSLPHARARGSSGDVISHGV